MYFDFGGKAEALRLAMTYQGLDFEDYRFQDREEFAKLKASGELMFGQVPALLVTKEDGQKTMLNQSAAMVRYIAMLSGKNVAAPATDANSLYPSSDPLKCALIDAIVDQEADAFQGLRVTKYSARFGFARLNEAMLPGDEAAPEGEVGPYQQGVTICKPISAPLKCA